MSARLIFLIIMFILFCAGCAASITRSQYDEDHGHYRSQLGFMIVTLITGVGAIVTMALIISLAPAMA